MPKRYIQVSIVFLASLTILACDMLSGPRPDEVLNKYLDASYKGRIEEAYSYVSVADKAVKDLQSCLKESEKEDNTLARGIASKATFKIQRLEASGNKAVADVEINLPDFESMFYDIMGGAFKSTFGDGDEKEMEKILAKKFESGKVPLTTRKQTFQMVKEDDGWKVFLDWKNEKLKKEKQATISNLMAEAKELRRSQKLEGAIEKYEKVLKLDAEMVDAKEGIGEVKTEIKQIEGKQLYINSVVLYDLQSKYYQTYLEERVPGVEFKIKNKGNRTLKEVEVTVYFKDSSGTIIAEKTYHPVLVTKYSFSSNNKPLKPNYIWQMERGKFYKADSVPTEWKEGTISAKITNIEFE